MARNVMDKLDQLAATARRETPPEVAVSQEVLLRLEPPPVSMEPVMVGMALAAMIAAGLVVATTVGFYAALADPLNTIYQTASLLSP